MQLSNAPLQLILPWANGDSSKTSPVPVPSQIGITPGAASWTDGYPPLCATPVTSGGIPPTKADFNGALYEMSAVDVWTCAGGGFLYNSGFSTAIGGYPNGARVLMASGLGYWRSIVNNNVTNPDTGGAGWVLDSPIPVPVAFSATPVFNCLLGNVFEMTLTGNVTSATCINVRNSSEIGFIIHQDGTGSRTFAWPSNVPGATIDPGAGNTNMQFFFVDASGTVRPKTAMTVS